MPKQYLDKIRQKYPQYNDLPDSTLAANILKKYPQYQDVLGDMVGGSAQPAPQKSEPSFLDQMGDIQTAPIKKMAQGFQESYQGNPFAGGLDIFNASYKNAMTPLNSLDLAVRQIPVVGEPLSDVARMVGSIPQKIGETAVQPLMPMMQMFGEAIAPKNLKTTLQGLPPIPSLRPEQQQDIQRAVTETAGNVAPFAIGALGETAGKLLPQGLAARFAAKSGKFTGSPDQVLKKANIALREGINPSSMGGLEKLNTVVDDLDNKIGSFAKSSDVMATDEIMKNIEPLIEKVKRRELAPQQFVDQINQQVDAIKKERGVSIPADLAHELKKGIYQREKAAYQTQEKTGKLPGYDTQVEMKVASGILDEWKKLYPETAPMLSQQSDLLNIRGDIRRTVRNELVKSNFQSGVLLALSPKWWLTKMIATNKTLEYNLGRLIYRAKNRGGPVIPPIQSDATRTESTPDVVTKARQQAESGQPITTAQANLIRQFFPDEAQGILQKAKR